MFLIDEEGNVIKWQLNFLRAVDEEWQPDHLITLPEIKKFSLGDLKNWLYYNRNELPDYMKENTKNIAKSMLDETENGVPERILATICYRCGHNWYELVREKWFLL